MEKSLKYCLKFLLLLSSSFAFSQYNCNAIEGEDCKKACELYNYWGKYQGHRDSQEGFDQAIELCPTFSDAFMEKAVPYLKNGDFATWKILIDKAVELNPKMHLSYRAWCKYQFLRDYKGAIADFDTMEKLGLKINQYSSQNGDYNLEIAKGICYSALGDKEKAKSILENQISKKDYIIGLYDYFQLGVTYYQLNNYDKAIENFEKQSKKLEFAENIFYKAKVSKIRNKDYLNLKQLALKTYDDGTYLKDPYTHHFNKVYRMEIAEL